MSPADIPAVAAVEADSFPAPWSREMFAEELANPLATYLVLEVAGQVCGYAGFWLVLGEAQVTNIALLSPYRGRGLGRCLVSALLKLAVARGVESVFLEVRQSNNRAQTLYAELGFVPYAVRPGYYQDNGEAAVLMKLSSALENIYE